MRCDPLLTVTLLYKRCMCLQLCVQLQYSRILYELSTHTFGICESRFVLKFTLLINHINFTIQKLRVFVVIRTTSILIYTVYSGVSKGGNRGECPGRKILGGAKLYLAHTRGSSVRVSAKVLTRQACVATEKMEIQVHTYSELLNP